MQSKKELMNITVFGGSHPQPGSPAYAEAYELGKLLGAAGHPGRDVAADARIGTGVAPDAHERRAAPSAGR